MKSCKYHCIHLQPLYHNLHRLLLLESEGLNSFQGVLLLFHQVDPLRTYLNQQEKQKYSKSLLIGNSTAGADGNVSIAYLPGQIKVYFTGLGIYYQGFKKTQRVGILPDIRLIPTLNGIKQNNDEVLDFAINQAKELIK